MLTKNDIKQIAQLLEPIKQDVRGLKQDVRGLKQDVRGLKQDVGGLKQDVGSLKQDMVFVKKSLRGLKMKTSRINNTLNVAIKVFDRNGVENRKKIQIIEDHLGLVA